MSFFAPRNQSAARSRTRRLPRPAPVAAAAAAPEPLPASDPAGAARLPGAEPSAVTAWLEPAVTTEGTGPHWWSHCSAPTPLRCVRLGLLFDALAVPTPVALRALEAAQSRPGAGRPGPVADCATGKAYFLVEPGGPAGGRRAVRRLSTGAHLWLPSALPYREEPVWWLEEPRPDASGTVRLGRTAALLPLLEEAFTEVAAVLGR